MSVYRVTEVIGTSETSFADAATVRDLRIGEVLREDVTIENGKITSYRVRLGISFKYESGD
jgi:flavin-binding protein dodecin